MNIIVKKKSLLKKNMLNTEYTHLHKYNLMVNILLKKNHIVKEKKKFFN